VLFKIFSVGQLRSSQVAMDMLFCGGTPHGRGSFAERTVSGGRLSGRGKGVAKQTGVATRGPLFTLCTKKGVLVPGGAGTFRGRCP
jgi:hypothetical protein